MFEHALVVSTRDPDDELRLPPDDLSKVDDGAGGETIRDVKQPLLVVVGEEAEGGGAVGGH